MKSMKNGIWDGCYGSTIWHEIQIQRIIWKMIEFSVSLTTNLFSKLIKEDMKRIFRQRKVIRSQVSGTNKKESPLTFSTFFIFIMSYQSFIEKKH